MNQVLVFNHIPKTAGMTLRYILWRTVGRERVLTSHLPQEHAARLEEISRELDRPLRGDYVVQTHIGAELEPWLPAQHTYQAFTFVREPLERAVSHYYFSREQPERWEVPPDASLSEFLDEHLLWSCNAQTAFLGGLWTEHYLKGTPIRRGQFDQALLDRAKQNLELHQVVGLTERFDESLMMLRNSFRWPAWRTVYRSVNRGQGRKAADRPTAAQLKSIRSNNELDLELYEFATRLFEQRFDRLPRARSRVKGFKRLNGAYARVQPIAKQVKSGKSVSRFPPPARG